MPTQKFFCDTCKNPFDSETLALEHEAIPIKHDSLKPGYVFRLDKRKGGWIYLPRGGILYPAREEGDPELEVPEYGVIKSKAIPNQEHVQMYNVFVLQGRWLIHDYNPHWVTHGQIPGDSTLVQELPYEEGEFDQSPVKTLMEHWIQKSQTFGFFDYKELGPGEKLELRSRL